MLVRYVSEPDCNVKLDCLTHFLYSMIHHRMMSPQISDDEPKQSISEDLLHRRELVDSLSDLIRTYDKTESLTIGICGTWGSGKTSLINFIEEELQNSKSVVFMNFNPWLYSSQENLASQFLRHLSYHFASKWRKHLYNHSSHIHIVSEAASTLSSDSKLSRMLKAFSDLVDLNTDGIPLEALKSTISASLKESDHKIVVVIDDVDRLDPSEIRMVMKLVRSIADFPNVIYILCYDDKIVEKALSTDEYEGHEYLQKIINLPIRLPEVNGFVTINALKDHFLKVVGRTESSDYEDSIFRCFSNCILTLRDVNSISSKFHLLFEISRNNTCPIDLLALVFLEVKDSSVYYWVSENRLRLCGEDLSVIMSQRDGKRDDPSQAYLERGMNPEYIDLLSTLFPRFKPGYYYRSNVTIEYRISSYRYINNYFLLTPSSLNITDELIEDFIRIDDPDIFFEIVQSLNSYLYEVIFRACEKMKVRAEYADYSHRLSDIVLVQPFSNHVSLPFQYYMHLYDIVETYMLKLPDSEKIDYLKSSLPAENIHKILFYGMIIDRVKAIYFDDNGDSAFVSIYREIFDLLTNYGMYRTIEDPYELLCMLILVSRTNRDEAERMFRELKPTAEERKSVYSNLIKHNISADFLTELVGDLRCNPFSLDSDDSI